MANWFDPGVLAEIERDAAESALEKVESSGDFGAYAVLNRTDAVPASLGSHNLIRVGDRVAVYRRLLKRNFPTICDLGCGAGLTTRELARQFAGAQVLGLEISREAVAYARRAVPEATFEQRVLAADTDLGRQFGLVLAQEFYPFTRTGDFAVHRPWLEMALRHVAPGGVALIVLSERDAANTILANLDEAAALCRSMGYGFETLRLPFDRIFHHLPVLWASRCASALFAAAGYNRVCALKIG